MKVYPLVKRAVDFAVALVLCLVLLPVATVTGLLILILDGWPIFFLQARPGLHGKPFVLLKFRTMSRASVTTRGDESARVTKLGGILRKTSVDEIPSLWNVVRGDLSFVGPRPLLMDYLEVYTPVHSQRHAVRPGLTGLAQVAGRNLVSWKERLDLDVVYVRRQGLLLDLEILFQTIIVVLSFRGIYQADGTTMARLVKGYDKE